MYNVVREFTPYLLSRSNHNKLKVILATLIDMSVTAINIGTPLLLANYAEEVSNGEHQSGDSKEVLAYVAGAALLLAQAGPRLRNLLISSVRANAQKEMAYNMVNSIFARELDEQVNARTGEFSLALTNVYFTIDKGIPSAFEIMSFLTELTALTILLTVMYGPLGLLPLGAFVMYVLVGWYGEATALPIRVACTTESYSAYGAIVDAVGNYTIAHQFGNVEHELETVNAALTRSETHYRKMHQKNDKNSLMLSLINGLGFVGSLILFALFPRPRYTQTIDMVLFIYFMMRLNARFDTLPTPISSLYTALIDGQRVVQFLRRTSTVEDIASPLMINPDSPLTIEFVNVSFSYQEKEILQNISFKVEPGEILAIAGPTGCGKSTIIKLLLRFYPVTSGTILINGRNIIEYSKKMLRQCFAVVSQESNMFNGSIEENIRYGNLNASNEEVYKAAVYAGLIKDSEEGRAWLKQSSGQQGGKLSGGEKQRVNIARALLKGGLAFILDEATSALDPKTEAEVQQTLDRITLHVTTFMITHRLNTAVNADKIIYLESGRIVEQGDFNELLIRHEKFYHQLETQCTQLGIDIAQIKPQAKVMNEIQAEEIHAFWHANMEQSLGEQPQHFYQLDDAASSSSSVSFFANNTSRSGYQRFQTGIQNSSSDDDDILGSAKFSESGKSFV